ncbi:hypothetical protein BROOK1789B_261 [Bathymodiolus brooksi thiotrophic gill symbiont]|nr:hypothetical protein BROOK1789B_261 [Bathymodiolus brooksi thiotrophic gill symbiont]
MKFKNIFFGFLRTLLLIIAFYSSALYADQYMFLDLRDYPYTTHDFRPYFFDRDEAGNVIKVPDTRNSFQFKTYNLDLKEDVALYRKEVRPTLLEWKKYDAPPDSEPESAARLSGRMEGIIERDLASNASSREVYVATYKGNVEAVSYVNDGTLVPEINTLVANPEGMFEGQTTDVKGGGSALLDNIAQEYQAKGEVKIRLYSINDEYYASRGWQVEPKEEGACGSGSI